MNINMISTVHGSLQQIREVTSSWDDDHLGDADIYAACDELRSVCVNTLTTLDNLLDEDKAGDSDDNLFDPKIRW